MARNLPHVIQHFNITNNKLRYETVFYKERNGI